MPPAPATDIAIRDGGKDVDSARTIARRPRAIAPNGMGRVPGRPGNATQSAAIVEPIPDAAIRNPNPDGPTWRTLSARGGVRTEKFIPNVDASPTIVTARSTIGVDRTYRAPSASVATTSDQLCGRGFWATDRSSASRMAR